MAAKATLALLRWGMFVSIKENAAGMVRRCVEMRAIVGATIRRDRPAIPVPAIHGHDETIAMLMRAQGNPCQADRPGFTPLYIASLNNHPEALHAPIKASADVDLGNNNGRTPLRNASGVNHSEMLHASSKPAQMLAMALTMAAHHSASPPF